MTFRNFAQGIVPGRIDFEMRRVGCGCIQCLAQGFGYLRRIHRTALASLDFDGGHTDFDEFGQHFQNIQAGRFFQSIVGFIIDFKAAFAKVG